MESKCDWYDYENQKAISLPPVGSTVILHNDNNMDMSYGLDCVGDECEVLAHVEDCAVLRLDWGLGCFTMHMLEPVDHDKHQVKTVSLDWLVDSGIDCEFTDDGDRWFVGELIGFNNPGYFSRGLVYEKCRPRQNHPMVLTDKQLNLIPAGFDLINGAFVNDVNIVTFKGLKDGYKYEWEAY